MDHNDFGSVVKKFRTRRGATQQQLAEQLGIRRNTVGSWERGDFLPQSKGTVLELARRLRLDDKETYQLLEASLTALAPYWSVPLPRNPFFTGREKILGKLHAQLGAEQSVTRAQSSVLHGLGGVGKTQIALEYAHRHALEYNAIFWIGAETDEQIFLSLLRIAEMLQLPEREKRDQQHIVTAIQRWLSTHDKWLLIWDNVESLEVVQRFLPAARSGAMLFTTRRQAPGTLGQGLDLLPMEREEGILFLLRRAKMLESEASREQVQQFLQQTPTQHAAAVELVETMGGLPLALDQAGAYLEETHCGLSAYVERFRTRRATLLQQRGEDARDHPASVSTTFTLAITATAERHPAVRDLLHACVLLQSDAIPEEIFCQGGVHLGATLEAVCHDPLEWDRVVGIACAYSLLARQPEEHTLSMHRLMQAVLLDETGEEEQKQWQRRVIEVLNALFPDVQAIPEPGAWKQCERLLPHVLQQGEGAAEALICASLDFKAAYYLSQRGQYAEAEPLHVRALGLREQALGPDHPEVAASLHVLGILYFECGKYAEAEPLCLRALQIREQALGADHPEVAHLLNNLANLYWVQRRYAEMEPLYLRAMNIGERVQGPDHQDVSRSLENLAMLYCEQGRYAEAEPLRLRSLQIREQTLGPDHPWVASSLSNLAVLYIEQGRYTEAEPLCVRAAQLRERVLGPEHPTLGFSLNNLAELYRGQGRYAEAEPLYLRALHTWERGLGVDHPYVAHPLNGLADLYREQGKNKEARAFYHRALLIREQQLDSQHPETAETLHGLALLQQTQGHLSEALAAVERALLIRSQFLGDTHPKTMATQALHAQLLQEQAGAEGKAASERCLQAPSASHENERHANEVSLPLQEAITPASAEDDPLQGFLEACCDLHPRAWCCSTDLWQGYTQWIEDHQEQYPLSRGAFITHLKKHGCHADRTRTARIWRGIALLRKGCDGG